ncbi:hypothetical protein Scep_008632 [Stephania cephalantha]|uniref:Uncharacterized protein n=1 Tax=Stephania cephalantha TaxID=152367 RepID=A0AAP0PPS4_9MAGN
MVKMMSSSLVLCSMLVLIAQSCIINTVHARTEPTGTSEAIVKIENEHPSMKSPVVEYGLSRKGFTDEIPSDCCKRDVLMINQIIDGESFVVEMIRNYITKGKPYVPPPPKGNPKQGQSILRRSPPRPSENPSYMSF